MNTEKNIVIIDDDNVSNFLHQMVIKDSGFTGDIEIYESSTEALQYLKDCNHCPDLIFLDLNMPKMDGYEFLAEMEKINGKSNIPIVILTSLVYKANINISEKFEANVVDVIEKPLSEDSVRGLLNQILQ
jgi:CheY-like chemotaxis protein